MATSDWDAETDILIAGGGGCGLVAALHARAYDLQVTLLEKEPNFGGTTAMSGGSIVAAGTDAQQDAGIEDSPEALTEDIINYTNGQVNESLVRALAEESSKLVAWLETDIGVELCINQGPYQRKGHRTYRRHWLVDEDGEIERNGEAVVGALLETARDRGVELLTNHPITALITEDGAVVGVEAGKRKTERISAKKVILATGGFAANVEMRERYCPESNSLLYWGDEGSTGDGIRFGQLTEGETENMAAYLGFPTIARPERVFVPWELSREGAVIVDQHGRRFADCGSCAYSEFTGYVAQRPDADAYLIFDQPAYDAMASQPSTRDRFENCLAHGAFSSAQTVAEIADTMSIDVDGLAETISFLSVPQQGSYPDGFGRTFQREFESPFYATALEPAIFQTQGGLSVDERGRVLTERGTPVPNLFAGGGAATGVSGRSASGYLSGNGLLAALNLGRITGKTAAKEVTADQ